MRPILSGNVLSDTIYATVFKKVTDSGNRDQMSGWWMAGGKAVVGASGEWM